MINTEKPAELEIAGAMALRNALGPAGMVRFLQQVGKCEGDYTEERRNKPEPSMEEAWKAITEVENSLKKETR